MAIKYPVSVVVTNIKVIVVDSNKVPVFLSPDFGKVSYEVREALIEQCREAADHLNNGYRASLNAQSLELKDGRSCLKLALAGAES